MGFRFDSFSDPQKYGKVIYKPMEKSKIVISGAGLTGSLLALLLGQRGYDVTILERRPDTRSNTEDSGRSINLALSSRGIHALKMAGLMDQVGQLLIPMSGRMLHFESGRSELMPYGQRDHEVIYSVSRRDLNAMTLNAAVAASKVDVKFLQKVSKVDLANNQIVVEDIPTGQSRVENFDLLIGADGAGSRTRRSLIPFVNGKSTSEFLDHDYKELEIPAATNGKYQIEKQALHIWPRGGYMLIALPNQDGSFTVTLFLPKSGPDGFSQLESSKDVQHFFEANFPSAIRLIPDLIQDYFDNAQGKLGTLRCSPWFYQDSCVILGDAAHAIVPFHGQGMNAGFEDCSELIRLLNHYHDDWKSTLQEFDRIRKPNADAIAEMALENYVTMRESVADPKFQLKKEIGFRLETRFPDRFVPRYSLVMFHRVPYATAYRRGKIQQQILSSLADEIESVNDVDFSRAEILVHENLSTLIAGPDGVWVDEESRQNCQLKPL
ncbi:MAG: NAD(P)/FAD-dependent oxidoreductase [Planctomycetota bacterium]